MKRERIKNKYSKIPQIGFRLIDVNYKDRAVILEKNDGSEKAIFSFEYWEDVNRYVTKEWDWRTKTVVK